MTSLEIEEKVVDARHEKLVIYSEAIGDDGCLRKGKI